MGFRPALLALTVFGPACLSGCTDLPSTNPPTIDIRTSGTWPDSVPLGRILPLAVTLIDSKGNTIPGARVSWRTTDSTILRVQANAGLGTRFDSLHALLSASVAAHAVGQADVIVTINHPGFAAAELREHLNVVRRPWPDTLTVTEAVIVTVAMAPQIEWESTDATVLRVSANPSVRSEATITAHARGRGTIVARLKDNAGTIVTEFRVAISVASLSVTAAAEWPSVIHVTDRDTFEVDVRDARGASLSEVALQWQTSNPSVVSIAQLAGGRAEVVARGRGQADVRVTAGGTGFESVDLIRSVSVLQKWKSVSAGFHHTCASAIDGTAYCWGSNSHGELGNGTYTMHAVPDPVATFLKFDEIDAGGSPAGLRPQQSHTCARLGSQAYCWGSYQSAQLGPGLGPCSNSFVATACSEPLPLGFQGNAANRALALATGGRHTCTIQIDEPPSAACWGMQSTSNALGWSGAQLDRTTWVSAGGDHACLQTSIEVFCIGQNSLGQLGDGTTTDRWQASSRVRDAGGARVEAFGFGVVSGGSHSCAMVSSLRAVCWGSNSDNQLGTTTGVDVCGAVSCSKVAVPVALDNIRIISAGGAHTCASTWSDAAYCWGSNATGQLGDSTLQSRAAATLVVGGHVFTVISAGWSHTCGLTQDGVLYCWGSNDEGQLGIGSFGGTHSFPLSVVEPVR